MQSTNISMGSGYNLNSTKLILAKILRVHGQAAIYQLIREINLGTNFGFQPGIQIRVNHDCTNH